MTIFRRREQTAQYMFIISHPQARMIESGTNRTKSRPRFQIPGRYVEDGLSVGGKGAVEYVFMAERWFQELHLS